MNKLTTEDFTRAEVLGSVLNALTVLSCPHQKMYLVKNPMCNVKTATISAYTHVILLNLGFVAVLTHDELVVSPNLELAQNLVKNSFETKPRAQEFVSLYNAEKINFMIKNHNIPLVELIRKFIR